MLSKVIRLTSALAIALTALTSIHAAGMIDDNAHSQNTRLAATSNVDVTESVTIRFETKDDLIESLRGPIPVNESAVNIIANKCESIIGQAVYPSQLAHLIFEVSYTDPVFHKLNILHVKNDVGYILSNLGGGNDELTEHLFAFYYGYTFEHFAPKKDL